MNQIVRDVCWACWQRCGLWLGPMLAGLFYYLAAWLGLKASIMSEGIAIFWPPNAMMLAVLLRVQPRRWPAYSLALIAAEVANDLPSFSMAQAMWFAAANVIEVVSAAGLLKISVGLPFKFERLRHVALFGLSALVLASGAAALLGAVAYTFSSDSQVSYWDNWRIWWFGDSLGLLIITPVLLGWWLPSQDSWHRVLSRKRCVEAGALLAIAAGVSIWIFAVPKPLNQHSPAGPMLLLPITIWAAARLDIRGTALINLLIAVVSIYGALNQQGPFGSLQQAEHVFRLQEYLATLAFSSLALAALVAELRLQNAQLRVLGRAVDTVQEGILITDAGGGNLGIIYANSGFAAISGYSATEVIGQNPQFLLDASSDPLEVGKISAAIEKRQRVRAIVRNRTKDGRLFWNQMTIDPVRNESGEVSHFIGIHHDITEMMETQSALRAAHRQLEAINGELEQRIEQRTQELQQANRKLAEQASTDPLTGAHNRRYFMDCAHEEFERTLRYGRALAVIAIDIDYFKRINDRYGHATGDRVLTELTRAAENMLRPADLFARFGGEEFILLLPETALDEAVNVAERLQAAISNLCITADDSHDRFGFSVSIGVAERMVQETRIEQMLDRADQALYAAKHAGRNCIRSAGRPAASVELSELNPSLSAKKLLTEADKLR